MKSIDRKTSIKINSFLFLAGIYYCDYIYSPLKKVYMTWKYRKEANEVKRKYLKKGK